MNVALLNLPWPIEGRPGLWGVRAGSRWPHVQKRMRPGALPRYIPFPFFLALAARVLTDAGRCVLLIDGVAENASLAQVLDRLDAFQPDLVFAETSTPSFEHDMVALNAVKSRLPKVVTVSGGCHYAPLVFRQTPAPPIDYWIAGEYDLALARLVDVLENMSDPASVAGVSAPGLDFRGFAVAPDVDSLPQPLYSALPMANYADPVCGLPAPGAQTWLSRGCPYGCSFCVWPQLVYGNRLYRCRTIDRALDEVEHLIATYDCQSYYFDDDTANLGEERMLKLARRIQERGLDRYPWAMMARADMMTEAMLDAFQAAGMYSIKYGVESACSDLVAACGKRLDLDRVRAMVDGTRKAGIKIHLTFTFGLPGETPETIRQTTDLALELAPDTAQFSICTPFPGTRFYKQCLEQGWTDGMRWSDFIGSEQAVVETPQLSRKALEQGYGVALERWGALNRKRNEKRRAGLRAKLEKALRQGAVWRLIGDVDFAQYLTDPRQNRVTARAWQGQAWVLEVTRPGEVLVVLSRHDEEKICRLRCRRFGAESDLLRFFG